MTNTPPDQPRLHLAGLAPGDLTSLLAGLGCPSFRAKQILEWYWQKGARSFEQMKNLPADLRQRLALLLDTGLPAVIDIKGKPGGTRKFLTELPDGECVESVILPAAKNRDGDRADRLTLCVSSQVGCAFGCRFCASGLGGFKRNLSPAEIICQILNASRIAGERIDNLVFMGMGEPLANYPNLIKALDIITSDTQLNIGARHITVSTSGNVPGLLKLSSYPRQIRLAVSLHGATDEVRDKIMPVNRKWPLAALKKALLAWAVGRKQMISLEYILIKDVNDSITDAGHLARFSRDLPVKINLIPYNKVDGLDWERPSMNHCHAFRQQIAGEGIPVTLRYEKGEDIDAACGQLRLRRIRRDKEEQNPTG